jgi:hypothetical protein
MLNLLLAWFLLHPGSSYSAVVVDAVSHRPLAGVSVRPLDASAPTSTDAHGHFQLPAGPADFDLSLDGYADLRGHRATQGDTLRLRPTSTMLPAVTVRIPAARPRPKRNGN